MFYRWVDYAAFMKPFIIPIFLPQMACPYRCVYCHQPKITLRPSGILDRRQFDAIIQTGLASRKRRPNQNREIAFYGGTFTNLPRSLQTQLLTWAGEYIRPGLVNSIRLSTRPDAISPSGVEWLMDQGVGTIELGIQSLNDVVLSMNNRGHTRDRALAAIHLLKKYPLDLGVQLMVGLPGDSETGFLKTVTEIIPLRPALIRIYPTLVFAETVLGEWMTEGRYQPLSLEEAVSICAQALELFESAGIKVIRLGLQDHPELNRKNGLLAGPFHPAFGFLARARSFLNRLCRDLALRDRAKFPIGLTVSPKEAGYLLGHEKNNLIHLIRKFGLAGLSIQSDPNLSPGQWQWIDS
jgi:histone acetyltransferase (RNA polymerase elongator complex component)